MARDQRSRPAAPDYEAVIEEFFSSTEKRLSEGGTREVGFDCSVSKVQGRFLHDLIVELRPENALEIGLAWGGSAVHINCAILENGVGHHTAIDPFELTVWSGIAVSEMKRLGIDERFTLVPERSDVALPRFVAEGRRFQFIFIDGDHRFDGVFVDFHYCQQLLDVGGLLIFDDSNSEMIAKVISFAVTNMPNLEYRGIEDGRFGVFYKRGEDMREIGDQASF